jgi:hypothetical protein
MAGLIWMEHMHMHMHAHAVSKSTWKHNKTITSRMFPKNISSREPLYKYITKKTEIKS